MFSDLGDLQLHHEIHGDGGDPPLLLLHGLGSSLEDWHRVVPLLSGAHRVITVDLRGHGRSTKPKEDYDLATMADDVARFLDDLGIARAHVFGISMGGMVAQYLALAHPERVERLILHNTAASLRPRDWSQRKAVFIRRYVVPLLPMRRTAKLIGDKLFPRPDQQDLRDYIAEQWLRNDVDDYRRATRATLAHRLADRVSGIRAPTLVLAAADDGTIPRSLMEELAAFIPGAELEVIPGCGHGAPLEVPEEICERVLRFLGAGARSCAS